MGPVEALCINTFIALLVGALGYGVFVTIRDVINATAAIVAGGVSFAAVYGMIAAWSGLLEPFGLREAIGDGLMVLLERVAAPFERLGRVLRRPSND